MTQTIKLLSNCNICPRNCNINRYTHKGYCKSSDKLKINLFQLHRGEEPVISGTNGSGTIFFSNCNLQCVFCQNAKISHLGKGDECTVDELANIMLKLQEMKAHNINFVTPTHFTPQIRDAILIAKNNGLNIPILWNTNAYEKVETLKMLDGLVDIYLPDFKYWNPETSKKYSHAIDYTQYAKNAIVEMHKQVGNLEIVDGLAIRGMIIRILVMPNNLNSIDPVLRWICTNIGVDVHISLMGQYYPTHLAEKYPEINRQITNQEYEFALEIMDKYGFENGFVQEVGSSADYTPNFI